MWLLVFVELDVEYFSGVIIDENVGWKNNNKNKHPYNNRPKWLLLKASSYRSIGHSDLTPLIAEIATYSSFKQT